MMTALKENSKEFLTDVVKTRENLVDFFDLDNLWDVYKNVS